MHAYACVRRAFFTHVGDKHIVHDVGDGILTIFELVEKAEFYLLFSVMSLMCIVCGVLVLCLRDMCGLLICSGVPVGSVVAGGACVLGCVLILASVGTGRWRELAKVGFLL